MSASSQKAPRARLIADGGASHVEIEILDARHEPVKLPHNLGRVELDLGLGAYSVRFRAGDEIRQRLVVLGREGETERVELDPDRSPQVASSAPLRTTAAKRRDRREPASNLSRSKPAEIAGGGRRRGRLLLFARDSEADEPRDPSAGLELRDLDGEPLLDLEAVGKRSSKGHWAGAHLSLSPGGYRLLRPAGRGGQVEQMVYVVQGWQSQVFLDGGSKAPVKVSVFMAPARVGFDPHREDLLRTEAALEALSRGRMIEAAVEDEMLWAERKNPMLGVYGAHFQLRRETLDAPRLRDQVARLLDMVGPHPDVLALGWALVSRVDRGVVKLRRRLEEAGPIATPPMLAASWMLLVEASAGRAELVPRASLSDRVAGRPFGRGPWLVWRGPLAPVPESPARKLAAEAIDTDDTERLSPLVRFGKRIAKKLKPVVEGFSRKILGNSLVALARHLDADPEAAHLLNTPRYGDLERRLARFVSPLADPMLRDLVQDRPVLLRRLVPPIEKRQLDEGALVAALGVPVFTAMRIAVGTLFKLKYRPVIPNKTQCARFVESEARGRSSLRGALQALAKQASSVRLAGSGRAVDRLAFLYLRFRNSPSASGDGAPTADDLASTLAASGYVVGEPARPVAARDVHQELAAVRQTLRGELAGLTRRLGVEREWIDDAVPPPNHYRRGRLFPPLPERADGAS